MAENSKRNSRLFVTAGLFALAFSIGFVLHEKLTLPFSNPWDIKGPQSAAKYNPHNDIVRFVFLVSFPAVVLALSSLTSFIKRTCVQEVKSNDVPYSGTRSGKRNVIIWIAVLAGLILAGGNTYRSQPLDTFHEGETLGPAVDYMNGKVPYKESIFIHGVFRDPLRSVLAFGLFGKSISALRTLDACLGMIVLAAFFVSSYCLYNRNIYFAALSVFLLLIIRCTKPFGIPFRLSLVDVAFLSVVALAAILEERIRTKKIRDDRVNLYIVLFVLGFLPTVSFANSVDRGFYLTTATTIFLIGVWVFVPSIRKRHSIPAIFGGCFLGLAVLGFAVKGAYGDFFYWTFVILPKYDPLLNGIIYPFGDIRFLVPVICFSGIVYWFMLRFIGTQATEAGSVWDGVRAFHSNHFMEIFLLLLSLVCYRRVLGRSDTGHLADAMAPLQILLLYVVMKHCVAPLIEQAKAKHRIIAASAVATIFLFGVVLIPKLNWAKWYRFPLGIPDKALIPENYLSTISFLKQYLKPGDEFMTMTSEASWYYFLDRPCPVRFQVVHHAMLPFYQIEMVEDLRKSKVVCVLFRNSHWANDMDGLDNESRLPIVVEYIRENFRFLKRIDDNEIWTRKVSSKAQSQKPSSGI